MSSQTMSTLGLSTILRQSVVSRALGISTARLRLRLRTAIWVILNPTPRREDNRAPLRCSARKTPPPTVPAPANPSLTCCIGAERLPALYAGDKHLAHG